MPLPLPSCFDQCPAITQRRALEAAVVGDESEDESQLLEMTEQKDEKCMDSRIMELLLN